MLSYCRVMSLQTSKDKPKFVYEHGMEGFADSHILKMSSKNTDKQNITIYS